MQSYHPGLDMYIPEVNEQIHQSGLQSATLPILRGNLVGDLQRGRLFVSGIKLDSGLRTR
jgi:hypothetical protein